MRSFCGVIFAALLASACTTTQILPGHPDAIPAIESFYDRNAWEEGARCVGPSMSVTRAEVLEETANRLVVQVRYYWRDNRLMSDRGASTCSGFATRTFTLENGAVVSMTGEQRR
jgi:uncharacterized protein YcfL